MCRRCWNLRVGSGNGLIVRDDACVVMHVLLMAHRRCLRDNFSVMALSRLSVDDHHTDNRDNDDGDSNDGNDENMRVSLSSIAVSKYSYQSIPINTASVKESNAKQKQFNPSIGQK